jgi:hypothetical protein
MIYIHTLFLILLGAMLDFSGIKPDGSSFWIIVFILLVLFITFDILIARSSKKEEEE